ncbi:MAG: hypothetical protein ACO33E_07130, partial [Aquiluna sp.]
PGWRRRQKAVFKAWAWAAWESGGGMSPAPRDGTEVPSSPVRARTLERSRSLRPGFGLLTQPD